MEFDYTYVTDPRGLAEAIATLDDAPLIGADTEAAGFHRYRDSVSLIQVSTRERNLLIDPIALDELAPLVRVLQDPEVETIFHDADFDLRILHRDLGATVRGLFDTQVAAAFLGARRLGLDAVLEEHLGISIPKKFQRADWAERPLSEEMREYAVTDTAYLPELRDRLTEALEQAGRLGWAREEFAEREGTQWEPGDEADAYLRVKGARDLPPRGLAILREVYAWREGMAEAADRAPFRVMPNEAMIALAVTPPRNREALHSVRGVPRRLSPGDADALLAAVERGLSLPEDELPSYPRPPRREREPEVEEAVERMRKLRNRRAEELGLDPGFLISRATLERIARARPGSPEALAAVPEVRRWQVEVLGDDLLKTI
jgi:ribonuclease D